VHWDTAMMGSTTSSLETPSKIHDEIKAM